MENQPKYTYPMDIRFTSQLKESGVILSYMYYHCLAKNTNIILASIADLMHVTGLRQKKTTACMEKLIDSGYVLREDKKRAGKIKYYYVIEMKKVSDLLDESTVQPGLFASPEETVEPENTIKSIIKEDHYNYKHKDCVHFIEKWNAIEGARNHRIPVDGNEPTKRFKRTLTALHLIQSTKYFQKKTLPITLIEKYKYSAFTSFDIIKALKRYALCFSPEYEPEDKKTLFQDFEYFIYYKNPNSNKGSSWFLTMLMAKPRKLADIQDESIVIPEVISKKYNRLFGELTKDDKRVVDNHIVKILNYHKKMKDSEEYTFYLPWKKGLKKIDTPNKFIEYHIESIKQKYSGIVAPNFLSMNGEVWKSFLSFIEQELRITLEIKTFDKWKSATRKRMVFLTRSRGSKMSEDDFYILDGVVYMLKQETPWIHMLFNKPYDM